MKDRMRVAIAYTDSGLFEIYGSSSMSDAAMVETVTEQSDYFAETRDGPRVVKMVLMQPVDVLAECRRLTKFTADEIADIRLEIQNRQRQRQQTDNDTDHTTG